MKRPAPRRLDIALTETGLVESRRQAQALILAGKVRVRGETIRAADRRVAEDEALEVVQPRPYVSRGGEKLAPALDALAVRVKGRVCADIGASTGGFTDVLLQRGAARVYAVDVGRGLLHWRLRQDERVVLMERVNARNLEPFPEPVALVTIDVSFIGLEKVIPAVALAASSAELLVLFKPQFQVERSLIGKKGVVRDEAEVRSSLRQFREWCQGAGYKVAGEFPSPVAGAEGNREVFLRLMPERD